ncbi:ABC transporter permease [Pseudoduganella armeniaca]|uniref:ABC transporter permease n=1 Tax=Pseudoduganella armeniaca TaxID=2072590 RepID=A0A2R4CGW8_9BURK|nr:ABC transporter permease [Pseudoduganella armeniaca]AVR98782.1 ABC transporter permease [Pseudoduganella armeniaca]
MFAYYFKLGLRNLRRNPVLTALMVLTLAVGVAASVSTLTILHVMSGDPMPHKSDRLFVPIFNNGPLEDYSPGDEPNDDQVSYRDAINMLAAGPGERRTAMMGVGGSLQPERKDLTPFAVTGGGPTRDFFAMFEIPFRYGQAWSAADDKSGADVIVLTRALSEKLYGNDNPVGRRVRLEGFDFLVTGVIDTWNPIPRFHRIVGMGPFDREDEFFVPLTSAVRHEWNNYGSTNCTGNAGPGYQAFLDSECTWLQFWFELRAASERAALQDWLDGYAAEQRKLGRMPRKAHNDLYNLTEWLEHLKVVGNDNKLSAWLAFGFLLLCLVNTIGLLLAKFSVRAAEVGVRRALGASRREIFQQFLTETAVVGLVGGLLGLLLALGALSLISLQSKQLALVARMDWTMLAVTFLLAVAAAVLAGLLPTWRACQVTPALQLKSQ